MTEWNIDVQATTVDGETVTLTRLSPYEHMGTEGRPCVNATTVTGALVCVDAVEAKRVRRTDNLKYE